MSKRLQKIQNWEALASEADYEPGKMAALCPISLRQLERYFLLQFQQSPRRWVRQLRCRLAQQLVAQGYSTKAIAADLNFGSESHFCHEFKKVYGVPPQSFAPVYVSKNYMSLSGNNVAFKQPSHIEQLRLE
jgi:AraC-like DNA-binding protein